MAMRSRTSNWYECKVKYQKTMEDGAEKVVSEQYVVDALSFTEAESVMLEEMSAYVSGSITITGIVKASYGEVFFSDSPSMRRRRKRSAATSTTWFRPTACPVACATWMKSWAALWWITLSYRWRKPISWMSMSIVLPLEKGRRRRTTALSMSRWRNDVRRGERFA